MTITVHLVLMSYAGDRADAELLGVFLYTRERDT
jgi:hypothetical protein